MSKAQVNFWDIFTNAVRSTKENEGREKNSNNLKKTSSNSTFIYQDNQAIVAKAIQPLRNGRVHFKGSWWPAHCKQKITLNPGEIVYVVGRQNITLIVEPASSISFKMRQQN